MGLVGAIPAKKQKEQRQFAASMVILDPPAQVATSTELVDESTFLQFNTSSPGIDRGDREPNYLGYFADLTPFGEFLNLNLRWDCTAFLRFEHYAGKSRAVSLSYREYLKTAESVVGGGLQREFVILNDSKVASTLRYTEIHTYRQVLALPVTPYLGAADPFFRALVFYCYQDSGVPLVLESGAFQVTMTEIEN